MQLVERGVELITGGVLADPEDRDLDRMFEGDEYALDPAESAAAIARDLADDLRDELVDHPGFRAALNALWPLRTPERLLAELLSSPARLAAVNAQLRREGHRGPRPARPAPGRGRRLDGVGRAAARRAGRAARPAPPPQAAADDRRPLRRRGAHADRRARPHHRR